jgi:hypothetical protein
LLKSGNKKAEKERKKKQNKQTNKQTNKERKTIKDCENKLEMDKQKWNE